MGSDVVSLESSLCNQLVKIRWPIPVIVGSPVEFKLCSSYDLQSIALFSIGKIFLLMRLLIKLSRTSLLFTRSVAEKMCS